MGKCIEVVVVDEWEIGIGLRIYYGNMTRTNHEGAPEIE